MLKGSEIKTLYKYVTAERVLTCLPNRGDGTLRATQLSALNDPLECAVGVSFVGSDESADNKQLADLLTSLHGTAPVRETEVAQAKNKYGSLYLRELLTRQLSQRFGIVSLTTNYRHPLMWSHYTLDGSGFVIGYNRDQLGKLTRRQGCLVKVRYATRVPILPGYLILADDNVNLVMAYKGDHWSYENEWRLIVELDETIGTGRKDRHGQSINLLRVPNRAVVSVYHTERTPVKRVEKVRRRLADPNNRYTAKHPTKLVLSLPRYGYEVAGT